MIETLESLKSGGKKIAAVGHLGIFDRRITENYRKLGIELPVRHPVIRDMTEVFMEHAQNGRAVHKTCD